jgi:hypothetical protein
MSYNFDEDNSWLDALVAEVPVKASQPKSAQVAQDRKWRMSSDFGQKISQAQQGHKRHTEHSRQAISCYHKQADSVLRSAKVAESRTQGIRRSRANPSAKLKAFWASGNPRGIEAATLAKQKPIMTPTGVFPSVKHAAEWARANGLLNARNKIGLWLKTHPDMFYYIKKENK